jgi:hypothetical protein
MLRPPQPDGCWSEGQIALEEARFCVACELIFAGTFHCPRCESEMVWPLARWLSRPPPAEPAATGVG